MFTKRKSWWLGGLLLPLLLLLIVVPTTFAFDGRDGETVIIAEDEVVADDLYVAANKLIVNGTIQGDLFAGVNEIEINGTVEGDVLAIGNALIMNGTINDDLRYAGQALIVADNASVGGDLLTGGYGIAIGDAAEIGGDVLFGAFGAELDGTIGGDVTGGGNGVAINGIIGGNVELGVSGAGDAPPFDPLLFNPNVPDNLPRVDAGLHVANSASVGGDFSYESSQQANIPAGVVAGGLNFEQVEIEAEEEVSFATQFGGRLWSSVQRGLVLILLGWLMLRFAPNLLKSSADNLTSNVGGGLLSGVLLYFGWPLLLIFGLIVVIMLAALFGIINLGAISGIILGLGLALLAIELILYILVLAFVGYLLVGWLVGTRLVPNSNQPIIPLAVGTFLLVILAAIPYVGGLVQFAIGVAGLGAIWLWWRGRNTTPEKSVESLAL